jgi:hypothetical protein
MLGFLMFWVQAVVNLLNVLVNSIQWEIGNSALKGKLPVTLIALTGAVIGGVVAGFFGAVTGGVTAAVLCEILYSRESARVC